MDGFGEAGVAEFFVGFSAFGGEGDVDFAFVVRVEFALDEGLVEVGFERTDDTGHLRGEDADGALDLANGEDGGGADEGIESEELRFGEVSDLGTLPGGEAFAPGEYGQREDFFGHRIVRIGRL